MENTLPRVESNAHGVRTYNVVERTQTNASVPTIQHGNAASRDYAITTAPQLKCRASSNNPVSRILRALAKNDAATSNVTNVSDPQTGSFQIRLSDSQPLNRNCGLMQPRIVSGRYRNEGEGNPLRSHQRHALQIGWATLTSRNPYNAPRNELQRVPPLPSNEGLSAQWIGHASFLIQVGGHNILTDPIFGDLGKVGPLPALYARKSQAGIDPANLPPIDFILISHGHRDHLDEPSLRRLLKDEKHRNAHILAPAGSASVFKKMGFRNVRTCNWWDQHSASAQGKDNLAITFVPAKHWSGLKGFDTNKHLWGGWIIANTSKQTTTYFAGDSAMDRGMFEQISQQFPDIDLALLPIGPCAPRHLMRHSHMDPAEAVQAIDVLKPRNFVPMHYGTFRLGPDNATAPKDKLLGAWNSPSRQQATQESEETATSLHVLLPSGRFDLEGGVAQPDVKDASRT